MTDFFGIKLLHAKISFQNKRWANLMDLTHRLD